MGDGWIKIHRELFKHPIWKKSTAEQKVILIALIGMANHEPKKWEWRGKEFEVKRGQTITSLDSIVEECGKGISTQNVRTALARFEKLGFLTNESTKSGRLITICNYCKWQDVDEKPNKDANEDITKTSQRPNKDLTPNKNDKNDKNNKKDIFSDVPDEIKENFMDWVQMRKDKKKPIKTQRAVTMALNKLNALSKNVERQKELIDYAVYRNWESFYPIPQGDEIPKPKKVEVVEEKPIDAVPMPEETKDRLSALGFGDIIGGQK